MFAHLKIHPPCNLMKRKKDFKYSLLLSILLTNIILFLPSLEMNCCNFMSMANIFWRIRGVGKWQGLKLDQFIMLNDTPDFPKFIGTLPTFDKII